MTPAVVAQVNRRVAQGSQLGGVRRGGGIATRLPLQVVHAQAVYQQQDFARNRSVSAQCSAVQRLVLVTQAHRCGQRIGGRFQLVSQHAV